MKVAWKTMLALGVLLVLMALNMDTTVGTGYGRVHNLGLQSEQLSLLILGCVLFLAGIVLLGFLTLKQTPEEQKRDQEQLVRVASDLGAKVARGLEEGGLVAANTIQRLKPGFNQWGWRLGIGLLVGFYWGVIGGIFKAGGLMFLAALAACFWRGEARVVLRTMLLITGVGLIAAIASFLVLYPSRPAEMAAEGTLALVVSLSVGSAAACLVGFALLRFWPTSRKP